MNWVRQIITSQCRFCTAAAQQQCRIASKALIFDLYTYSNRTIVDNVIFKRQFRYFQTHQTLTSNYHYFYIQKKQFHLIVTIFFAKHVFQSYTKTEPNLISHRILRYHHKNREKKNKPVNQKKQLSKEIQASKQLSLILLTIHYS